MELTAEETDHLARYAPDADGPFWLEEYVGQCDLLPADIREAHRVPTPDPVAA